ncbi:VOC family protein [Rathayibacter iranicus]|uniref:Bleomycin resistance protein n=2 Tax=Rathayibacter iranicus TaxID=59737 RepID=A0AAD1AEW7_9MICO|nr:bleomycin resistance protein [Rathayibacter iranicus]AZZ55670.1 bleomycin resistance protein [Rathayibacter iranicus]MWV31151.1 VOC family protein [Rathayibacter iranicus NCPPB 2253 = VKM Ac-1602]PPI47940.1 bleomycin resistance protein [Rathayibacter iranicus]PPI61091.1 bleomycin resistance protein [Rathayibacter iranicus]PPI72933.1 bleomycin resistance protein [Rathayibacter iranicus]
MVDHAQSPVVGSFIAGAVTVGIPVRDLEAAVTWHQRWIGREPDLVPMPGMVEWRINDGCYLQFFESAEAAGAAVVRLSVTDAQVAHEAALAGGLDIDPIEDYGFVKFTEFRDHEGNRFGLVQEDPSE